MRFLFIAITIAMVLAACRGICEVKLLKTPEQVLAQLKEPGNYVLMYSADWCGACTDFKPTYKELSEEYDNVTFLIMEDVRLKEHGDKVKYIPTIVAGKDNDGLRNKTCWFDDEKGRSKQPLRAFIRKCFKL